MNKKGIMMVFGFAGSGIIEQMGGWSIPLQLFFWCIVLDYMGGLIVAGVFHNSPKTKNGKLSSKAIFQGIVKKFMYICIIILGRQIDLTLGVNYIMNGLTLGFITLDLTSIIENIGLMGIKLPPILSNSLELLNKLNSKGD